MGAIESRLRRLEQTVNAVSSDDGAMAGLRDFCALKAAEREAEQTGEPAAKARAKELGDRFWRRYGRVDIGPIIRRILTSHEEE